MKNKAIRGKIIFVAAAILLLAIAVFVYKQPVEIGISDTNASLVFIGKYDDGDFNKYGRLEEIVVELSSEDEGFGEIIILLKNKEYKKIISQLIYDESSRMYPVETGDFKWTIVYADMNQMVTFNNMFGYSLSIEVEGKDIQYYEIERNDPWLREVFDTAVKYAEQNPL